MKFGIFYAPVAEGLGTGQRAQTWIDPRLRSVFLRRRTRRFTAR